MSAQWWIVSAIKTCRIFIFNLKIYIAYPSVKITPCSKNTCGLNAICEDRQGVAICSCRPTFVGQPPNCRPECVTNSECSSDKACINYRCENPCIGLCGFSTNCVVRQHVPYCSCLESYEGNPYIECKIKPISKFISEIHTKQRFILKILSIASVITNDSPCNCGINSYCLNDVCKCPDGFSGNPYEECKAECIYDTQCGRKEKCINMKCVPSCNLLKCGENADCNVNNHNPFCTCITNYYGNPYIKCVEPKSMLILT